jgi:phosphate transport system substrate-binding protein
MERIVRVLSCGFIALAVVAGSSQAHAEEIKVGGTGAGLGIMRLLADAFVKTDPDVSVTVLPSLGSSGGIKALAAGAIQLSVSSRDLKDAERQQGLTAVEFGRTPFVFAVSAENETSGITMSQLVDIYSGKTTRWPDGTRIRLVLRPVSEADSAMIRNMSPEMAQAKKQAQERPGMLFAITDQDNQDDIENIAGAIGGTSLGQIVAERRKLKALVLDGVQPTPQNLADGSYPHAKILFLVTGQKTPPAAHRFAEFVQSPAGREILGRTGYWVR